MQPNEFEETDLIVCEDLSLGFVLAGFERLNTKTGEEGLAALHGHLAAGKKGALGALQKSSLSP